MYSDGALQAVGAAKSSLFAAIFRQGIVYIPLLFVMGKVFGLNGLVASQPIAEFMSLLIVIALVVVVIKKMKEKE